MTITEQLFNLRDEKYAEFTAKLSPTLPKDYFIGVRVPALRKLAKEIIKENRQNDFLNQLPHKYYDENLLHSILISLIKDFDICLAETEKFLPFINSWAVCDTLTPKAFNKNKEKLLAKACDWCKSKKTYICRFGVDTLMSYFLDDDFQPDFLKIPAEIHSEEYYINMMIAWFYATALAKHWEETVFYLENELLDKWVHNKTIQKAIESYRITESQKSYLKTLRKN